MLVLPRIGEKGALFVVLLLAANPWSFAFRQYIYSDWAAMKTDSFFILPLEAFYPFFNIAAQVDVSPSARVGKGE